MKGELKRIYDAEMAAANAALSRSALDEAFAHLERAHILGQRYFFPHLDTHWRMLHVAQLRRDGREVRGQVVRLAAVFIGYATGWVPKGNTGGADVPATKPMPPPADLAPLLADYNVSRDVMVRVGALAVLGAAIFAWSTL